MGLTREEFATLVKGINAVFADCIKDKDAFDVWYALLSDLSYKVCSTAVHKYMMTEKFPPKPADIRRLSSNITTGDVPSEIEAWAMVRKAVEGLSWDDPQKSFDKLPEVVQKAVGNPMNLKEWAMSDIGDFETVISSNFMRTYKASSKVYQENKQINPAVLERIEQIKSNRLEVHDDKF